MDIYLLKSFLFFSSLIFFFCHNQLVRSAPGPFFFPFLTFSPNIFLCQVFSITTHTLPPKSFMVWNLSTTVWQLSGFPEENRDHMKNIPLTQFLCTFFHSQFSVTAYLSIQSFCSLETVSKIHCLFKSIPFPLVPSINIASKGETWIPGANLNPSFLLSCIFPQLPGRSGFIFTLILFVCFSFQFPSVLSIPSLVLPFFHGSSECL